MPLVLTACGFAVYGNALANPFHIDDRFVILGDERVQQADMGAIFTEEYWPGGHGNRLYRPLVLASFALNWAVSETAWTFRLVNLLLHIGAAYGLFLLIREVTRQRWPALAAALFFVVHPIHTTPLNQIVDRADISAALCVLLAAWLYRRDGGGQHPANWVRPILAAGLFAGGLLCKENAVTLIGIVVLLDICRLPRNAGSSAGTWIVQRVLRCYLPMLLILVGYLVVRTSVLGGVSRSAGEVEPLDNIIANPEYRLTAEGSPMLARWGTPVAVFGQGVFKLLWPRHLSWDYSYAAIDNVRSWADGRLWSGCAVLAAAFATVVISWRRRRLACLAVGITLVTYSVVSNTFILIGSAFAERYLYLPSVGVCMLAGLVVWAGIQHVQGAVPARRRLAAGGLLMAAVVAWCGGAAWTVVRNRDFALGADLNAADLRTNPRSARLWCSVAADALNGRRYGAALEHAQRAVEIVPEYARAWRIAGLAHWGLQEPDPALGCLRRSIELGAPDDENVVIVVANILKSRGDYRAAIELLEACVARRPESATALNNLAWYLITAEPARLRDPERALPYAERAARLNPTAGDILDTQVAVLLALGRREEARRILTEGLRRIAPDDPYRAGLLEKAKELGL